MGVNLLPQSRCQRSVRRDVLFIGERSVGRVENGRSRDGTRPTRSSVERRSGLAPLSCSTLYPSRYSCPVTTSPADRSSPQSFPAAAIPSLSNPSLNLAFHTSDHLLREYYATCGVKPPRMRCARLCKAGMRELMATTWKESVCIAGGDVLVVCF